MTRRLSITVPDEVWDSVSHLEDSQSKLVQRALRCLHDTEVKEGVVTPVELGAIEIPEWQKVLDNLTEQATALRAEGYEAVLDALSAGIIDLYWLELVTKDYPDDLANYLSAATDFFIRARNMPEDGSGKWIERPVELDEIAEILDEQGDWDFPDGDLDQSDRQFVEGFCRVIVNQQEGDLCSFANGWGEFHVVRHAVSSRIPPSLFEGAAAAISDTVGAVHRRVRAENLMSGRHEGSNT